LDAAEALQKERAQDQLVLMAAEKRIKRSFDAMSLKDKIRVAQLYKQIDPEHEMLMIAESYLLESFDLISKTEIIKAYEAFKVMGKPYFY